MTLSTTTDAEILEKLQAMVSFVWDNEYCQLYRRHWETFGITAKPTIKSFADFQKLPAITKADFQKAGGPDDRLFVPRSEACTLHSTSGSSGAPTFFFWKKGSDPEHFQHMRENGSRRFLCVWSYHRTGPKKQISMTDLGVQTLVVDPHQIPEIPAILRSAPFDSLYITPSLAVYLAEYVKDAALLAGFRAVVLCGEHCSVTTYKTIQKWYPNALIYTEFLSAEMTAVAMFSTSECSGGSDIYHVRNKNIYVDRTESGELFFTNLLLPQAMPLIRYETGDHGEWVTETCSCGMSGLRMRYLGRSGVDYVRTRGLEIRRSLIENALDNFSVYLEPIMQATVHEYNENDSLKIVLDIGIVLRKNVELHEHALAKQIHDALNTVRVSQNLNLKDAVSKQIIQEVKVHFLSEIPAGLKNSSIKLVTDS